MSVPSQYYPGSTVVSEKTNEIPVAQPQLLPAMDLEGRLVSLDALHTQDETARVKVMEGGHGRESSRQSPLLRSLKMPQPQKAFMNGRCSFATSVLSRLTSSRSEYIVFLRPNFMFPTILAI